MYFPRPCKLKWNVVDNPFGFIKKQLYPVIPCQRLNATREFTPVVQNIENTFEICQDTNFIELQNELTLLKQSIANMEQQMRQTNELAPEKPVCRNNFYLFEFNPSEMSMQTVYDHDFIMSKIPNDVCRLLVTCLGGGGAGGDGTVDRTYISSGGGGGAGGTCTNLPVLLTPKSLLEIKVGSGAVDHHEDGTDSSFIVKNNDLNPLPPSNPGLVNSTIINSMATGPLTQNTAIAAQAFSAGQSSTGVVVSHGGKSGKTKPSSMTDLNKKDNIPGGKGGLGTSDGLDGEPGMINIVSQKSQWLKGGDGGASYFAVQGGKGAQLDTEKSNFRNRGFDGQRGEYGSGGGGGTIIDKHTGKGGMGGHGFVLVQW